MRSSHDDFACRTTFFESWFDAGPISDNQDTESKNAPGCVLQSPLRRACPALHELGKRWALLAADEVHVGSDNHDEDGCGKKLPTINMFLVAS